MSKSTIHLIDYKQLKKTLAPLGITIVRVDFEVEVRCDRCGCEHSMPSVNGRLWRTWWRCVACRGQGLTTAEGGQRS